MTYVITGLYLFESKQCPYYRTCSDTCTLEISLLVIAAIPFSGMIHFFLLAQAVHKVLYFDNRCIVSGLFTIQTYALSLVSHKHT